MEMAHQGSLKIVPMVPVESVRLGALMKRYPKMQFADACVVRLAELMPDAVVYTTDKRDFSIYRKNVREVIRTVTP